MKISIECCGVLIRNPQAHVPTFTDKYLPAVNSLVLPKVERADYNAELERVTPKGLQTHIVFGIGPVNPDKGSKLLFI